MAMFVLVAPLLLLHQVTAANHAVGGSSGWDESTDFNSWASAQTFKPGDSLDFAYSALHSVMELGSEAAFKNCDITTPLKSYNGGSTTIKLTKPGTRYFACGTSGHCDQGMKVKINTVASDAPPSSSSSSSPSQSGTATTTTSSSPPLHFLGYFVSITSVFAFLPLSV